MPSLLQAELRLTHRLIRGSCQICSRRCESPKRSFHTGRKLRLNQPSHSGADAAAAPRSSESQSNEDTAAPRSNNEHTPPQPPVTPASPQEHPPPSILSHLAQPDNGKPPSEDPDLETLFAKYGSARRRRQRANGNKEAPKVDFKLPSWFLEENVITIGEGPLAPGVEAQIDWTSTGSRKVREPKTPESDNSSTDAATSTRPDIADFMNRITSIDRAEHSITGRIRRRAKEPRYIIDGFQGRDILWTANGLIQPTPVPELQGEPAHDQCHLLLHSAVKDAELLLDEEVCDLAAMLGCDLVTLDAQDIAELISISNPTPEVVAQARRMSYDVLSRSRDTAASEVDPEELGEGEEEEGDDDMGIPVVMGRPFTIQLDNFLKRSKEPEDDLNPFQPRDLPDSISASFALLAERIFTALAEKRANLASSQDTSTNDGIPSSSNVSRPRTIIHIKQVKDIQEIGIASKFLFHLFEQVKTRRNNGEETMIIGTECIMTDEKKAKDDWIEQREKLKDHEVSRSLVLTPVIRSPSLRWALEEDRKTRFARANLRHIYEMLRVRPTGSEVLGIGPGFWSSRPWPIVEKVLDMSDLGLDKKMLSFSEVHRLTTVLAGLPHVRKFIEHQSAEGELLTALALAKYIIEGSDESKRAFQRWQSKNQTQTVKGEKLKATKMPSNLSKHERKLMSGVIEPGKISTTFNDVHAPAETVDALQTLTTLSLIRPDAFSYGVLASDKIPGLLLYGPPGTGKTMLAKAVAKESGAKVLEVSAADINDMYVGEGEKNVKALFSLAKKLSPCIVFLDEADAMFSARSNTGRRVSHKELLNQFLKEWDGMTNDAGSAFIMVATNRPMDLDDAVLRRLPRRLLVDLPTEKDRSAILKIHLKSEQLAEGVDIDDLAKKTPFYSGSDLKNLAVAAALNAVKAENAAYANFRSAKAKAGGEDASNAVKGYKHPEKRILTAEHFTKALDEITASISEDMDSLKAIKKFDEQYGDRRGNKKKRPLWGFKSAKEADKVLETRKVREA